MQDKLLPEPSLGRRPPTLEQLEACAWPSLPADGSPMVTRCHALRNVPLEKLSAGDCRVLLTQGIGARYILPIALEFVEADPMLPGDYYPGDPLLALLQVPRTDWSRDASGFGRLKSLASRVDDPLCSENGPEGAGKRLSKDIRVALALTVPDLGRDLVEDVLASGSRVIDVVLEQEASSPSFLEP